MMLIKRHAWSVAFSRSSVWWSDSRITAALIRCQFYKREAGSWSVACIPSDGRRANHSETQINAPECVRRDCGQFWGLNVLLLMSFRQCRIQILRSHYCFSTHLIVENPQQLWPVIALAPNTWLQNQERSEPGFVFNINIRGQDKRWRVSLQLWVN